MTTHVLKPLAIALLLGIAPLSISTAYAVAAVTGPAGPTGATGAKGDTGLPGINGTNGLPGATGATGATGLTGSAGAKGINGTNGTTGAQGLTGATGPSGGVKGDTGATGATGAIGPIGLTGATGPAGAAGTGGLGGSETIHVIGDSYAGGIVFWVDASGEHGLIAARADQSAGVSWNNGILKFTGTSGSGVYAGAMNTALIVAQLNGDTVGGNFAAKVAADYSVKEDGITACTGAATETCYGDWYLPSKFELNLLYQQKVAGVVGGFAHNYYWSSTQSTDSADHVWHQTFDNYYGDTNGSSYSIPVRAIRAF